MSTNEVHPVDAVLPPGQMFLIALGLVPKLATLVASIPQAVVGGAGIAMFGMVAATGIKILSRVDFESRSNLLIVAVSIGAAFLNGGGNAGDGKPAAIATAVMEG